jgi:hypothetical protein
VTAAPDRVVCPGCDATVEPTPIDDGFDLCPRCGADVPPASTLLGAALRLAAALRGLGRALAAQTHGDAAALSAAGAEARRLARRVLDRFAG